MTGHGMTDAMARAREVLAGAYLAGGGLEDVAGPIRDGANGVIRIQTAIAAMLTFAREHTEPQPGWPDIGSDPMKIGSTKEQAIERVREAYVRQQPIVPDQTALVWRWDIGRLLMEYTRLSALAKRLASSPPPPPKEGGLCDKCGGTHVQFPRSGGDCSGPPLPAGPPPHKMMG